MRNDVSEKHSGKQTSDVIIPVQWCVFLSAIFIVFLSVLASFLGNFFLSVAVHGRSAHRSYSIDLGGGAVFALGRKTEQFCKARFVSLAHGTVSIRLNPFWMFLAQSLVDLVLEFNVHLRFLRNDWRSVRLHAKIPSATNSGQPLRVRRIFQCYSRGDLSSLFRDRSILVRFYASGNST
jgi:hypothetical protein